MGCVDCGGAVERRNGQVRLHWDGLRQELEGVSPAHQVGAWHVPLCYLTYANPPHPFVSTGTTVTGRGVPWLFEQGNN